MASPDSAGVSKEVAAETIVVPLNDIEAVKKAFALHRDQIAAIIVEAVPANNGLLLQTDAYLKDLTTVAHANGALILLDEVITGFRVGFGGMAGRMGLTPDLVTYGKVIGGGFPVGAYGGRLDLMDLVAPMGPVYQAGTLSANPVAMCAGIAMLKKLKRDNPYSKLERRVESIAQELESIAKKADVQLKVQRFASMFWTIFGPITSKDGVVRSPAEIPSIQKERYAKGFHALLDRGIYCAPSGYEVSFVSTAHEDAHYEKFLKAFGESIRA